MPRARLGWVISVGGALFAALAIWLLWLVHTLEVPTQGDTRQGFWVKVMLWLLLLVSGVLIAAGTQIRRRGKTESWARVLLMIVAAVFGLAALQLGRANQSTPIPSRQRDR